MPKPDLTTIPSFYHNYVKQVNSDSLQDALSIHEKDLEAYLSAIPAEKWSFRYADGKWSVKELVQHIIDTERIFCYRALCFARKDATPLPGFDENAYAAASYADRRSKDDLLAELKAVQQATLHLFRSFDETQLESSGVANGNPVSVHAIGFILVGHALHHKQVLKERYL